MPEKYLRVYERHGESDHKYEVLNGTGKDDILKLSNLHSVSIANKTFVGTPSENCIDCVRGGPYSLGPNFYSAIPGVCNITAKGGISGLTLRGNFGKLEWGQFSLYDKWFKLPKSSGLRFADAATGEVEIWYGESPETVPPGVKIKKVNIVKVYAYFIWRSIQLTFGGK